MADIKQIQVGDTTYNIEPYTSYLPLTGGTLSGNLNAQYITGTWLQTTAASDLGSTPSNYCVIDSSGWLYKRTLAETKSDLNVPSLAGNGSANTAARSDHIHAISEVTDLQSSLNGKLNDYGSDTSRPGGTSFTFPGGSNPVQMRSGNKNGGRDIGIFSLTDDNAFICNSSDSGYAFAVFDTDQTADFRTASNAAFAVLSDHAGVSIKGGLTVGGTLNATKFTVDAEHTGGTIQYNAANGCMEIIC